MEYWGNEVANGDHSFCRAGEVRVTIRVGIQGLGSVRGQDIEALNDGVQGGDGRRRDAGQRGLDALQANDGARGGVRHDLIVGAQAAREYRMLGGLEGLPEGIDDEPRRMVALQQTEDLLGNALVCSIVEAAIAE